MLLAQHGVADQTIEVYLQGMNTVHMLKQSAPSMHLAAADENVVVSNPPSTRGRKYLPARVPVVKPSILNGKHKNPRTTSAAMMFPIDVQHQYSRQTLRAILQAVEVVHEEWSGRNCMFLILYISVACETRADVYNDPKGCRYRSDQTTRYQSRPSYVK